MHADFLAAIRAEPDDLTHRLVYADWLEEHGTSDLDRARAELIRVQIGRERADPDGDDYWTLRARERWLLARWNKGLAGELRRLVRRYRFRRGFIEWVELDARQSARSGDRLRQLAPVRGVRPFESGLWEKPPFWPGLTAFDLSKTDDAWDPGDLKGLFEHLPDLRDLDAGRAANATVASQVGWLLDQPVPPGLRSLALPGELEPDVLVGRFLTSSWLSCLESLTLRGTTLEYPRPMLQRLSDAPAAANLRELRLESGTELFFGHQPGPHLRNLRVLELRHCGPLWYAAASWLSRLPLPELRELRIIGCEIADDALELLFRKPGWPHLHTLDIRSPVRCHPSVFEALTDGPILPKLRRLALGWIHVESLRRLVQGRTLLSEDEERDRGQGPGRLAELCVWLGPGPADTLASLSNSPYLKGLTTVEIPGNGPLDLGSFHLPHLTWLDVRGRELPRAAVARQRARYGPGFRFGACPEIGGGVAPPPEPGVSDEIPF
jgi:uncharacterized protein (TIGR02996 family)